MLLLGDVIVMVDLCLCLPVVVDVLVRAILLSSDRCTGEYSTVE